MEYLKLVVILVLYDFSIEDNNMAAIYNMAIQGNCLQLPSIIVNQAVLPIIHIYIYIYLYIAQ